MKKVLTTILFLIAVLLVPAGRVLAAEEQTDHSTLQSYMGNINGYFIQTVTGVGSISSIDFYSDVDSSHVHIQCIQGDTSTFYLNGGGDPCNDGAVFFRVDDEGGGVLRAVATNDSGVETPFTLDGTHYYAFTFFVNPTPSSASLYGSATDKYSGGSCHYHASSPNTDLDCSSIADWAFSINGSFSGAPDWDGQDVTHVMRINSPTSFGTTTSPFTLSFDAYVTDYATSTDGYVFTVHDELTGQDKIYYGLLPSYDAATPFNVSTTTLTHSDSSALVGTVQLVSGMHDFLTRGIPYDDASVFMGVPVSQLFAIGSSYSSSLNPQPAAYAGNGFASTTCSVNFLGSFDLSGCFGYLISPSSDVTTRFSSLTLTNRFPFSYAYQLPTMYTSLFAASSTASTTISVNIPWFNHSTVPFALMKKEWIDALPFASLMKSLFSGVMWMLTIYACYKLIMRSHNQNTGI